MSTEVQRLLTESRDLAAQGRALIDQAIATRRQALDAVQPGVILDFPAAWKGSEMHFPVLVSVRRRNDGSWEQQDGPDAPWRPASGDWVEEQWDRGNLVVRGVS